MLIAAREVGDRRLSAWRLDVQRGDVTLGHRHLLAPWQEPQRATAGLHGQNQVFADTEFGNDAVALAIFATKADAGLDRLARRLDALSGLSDRQGAIVGAVDPKEQARDLAAPGAK